MGMTSSTGQSSERRIDHDLAEHAFAVMKSTVRPGVPAGTAESRSALASLNRVPDPPTFCQGELQ